MDTTPYPAAPATLPAPAAVDIVIRFKDSAGTLPDVLRALENQTFRNHRILGVDTGSTDGSADMIRAAGGDVILWEKPYNHPKVLNFGLEHCTAPLVLALSSHTAFTETDTLERMVASLDDPAVACASGKWDEDPFYSDDVTLDELKSKGLKLGSIYSNSMGLFRRSLWLETPFDEVITSAEDYDWAVEQLSRGHRCRRLSFPFDYQRTKNGRSYPVSYAVFCIARKHGLEVCWLGAKGTARELLRLTWKRFTGGGQAALRERAEHWGKFKAWIDTRKGS